MKINAFKLKCNSGKLINQYEEKYESRNVWSGYFITLIAIGILVYFLVRDEI